MKATLDQVLELTVLLGRDMIEGLAREGLTEPRAHLLWKLQRRGLCTQRVLAGALQVAPRTITTLVDGLVSTGFVTRAPHPSDRRATLVTFTPLGHAAARALVEGHRQPSQSRPDFDPTGPYSQTDARSTHLWLQPISQAIPLRMNRNAPFAD